MICLLGMTTINLLINSIMLMLFGLIITYPLLWLEDFLFVNIINIPAHSLSVAVLEEFVKCIAIFLVFIQIKDPDFRTVFFLVFGLFIGIFIITLTVDVLQGNVINYPVLLMIMIAHFSSPFLFGITLLADKKMAIFGFFLAISVHTAFLIATGTIVSFV